jgi:hypothetical protein
MSSIVLRSVLPTDHAFIYATYLNNNWHNKDNTTTLEKNTWMRINHMRLERLLNEAKATIACLSEDEDVILGYCLQDKQPFVYVKKDWRDPDLNLTLMLLKSYEEKK